MRRLSIGALIFLLFASCGAEVDDVADAGEPDGGDADTPDAGDADVDQPPVPLNPRFAMDEEGWLRLPWPSDYRIDEDGRVELDDFPRARDAVISSFIEVLERDVDGYSTVPVVFVAFDGSPEDDALPEPAETLTAVSPVQLVELSSEHCGRRIPIELRFRSDGDGFRPDNTLAAAPVPGFPLEPSTVYGLVILQSFNERGAGTTTPAELSAALDGSSDDDRLVEVYEPLVSCASDADIELPEIAVATVFTTHDPVAEMRLIREVVIDPEATPSPTVEGWEFVASASNADFTTYAGRFDTPIFQRGETPYETMGGGVEFDADGTPIVQRWEEVVFHFSFPTGLESPVPVMLWEDGTGATPRHHIGGDVFLDAIDAGFAVACFVPQFHGNRSGPTAEAELHTFNFLNPESGRNVFRQQVADTAYFIRVIREALAGLEAMPELDTSTLVFGGQSQGAIVGALVSGVETEIKAYVLNGVGGYMSITATEVTVPTDYNALFRLFLGVDERLDRFHPVVALLQMGSDVVDPINYGRHWRGWESFEQGSNLFLINGIDDDYTPVGTMSTITIAGGAQPIEVPGWDVDPFDVWGMSAAPLPIIGNTESFDGTSLTIATYLSDSNGHFTIYDRPEIRVIAVDFWVSALTGVPALNEM